MDSLSEKIIAEKENVEIALENLKKATSREVKTIIELAATGTFLHNIYNGIENILKQILQSKKVEIPKSETWHKNLLNLSVTNGIISEKLSDELYEYLTFRHFFIHAYGFMLEEIQLKDLADNIPELWTQFLLQISGYFKKENANGME
ncbi:MAG: DUF86 domain-containing protein [Bacteroidia bacterium]|nr:DUF86 domain-containing protein [Bacteroidia bacterium]